MPPTFGDPVGAIFLAGFMFVSLVLILSPRRPDVFETLVYLVFGFLGLKMIRGSIWFGLFMAPAVARHLHALVAARPARPRRSRAMFGQRTRRFLNAVVVVALLLLALASTPGARAARAPGGSDGALLAVDTPVAAVEALRRADLDPNVFHDQRFGSYLIWAAPRQRVFVDARFELYSPALFEEYFSISSAAPGWEERLAARNVRALLISPLRQGKLLAAVKASGHWTQLYADETAVLFARRE